MLAPQMPFAAVARIAGISAYRVLAGATVLQALIGFGHTPHLHARRLLEDDQSVVVEIVDEEQKLRAFAAGLADLPDIGLITLEAVEVLRSPNRAGDRG